MATPKPRELPARARTARARTARTRTARTRTARAAASPTAGSRKVATEQAPDLPPASSWWRCPRRASAPGRTRPARRLRARRRFRRRARGSWQAAEGCDSAVWGTRSGVLASRQGRDGPPAAAGTLSDSAAGFRQMACLRKAGRGDGALTALALVLCRYALVGASANCSFEGSGAGVAAFRPGGPPVCVPHVDENLRTPWSVWGLTTWRVRGSRVVVLAACTRPSTAACASSSQ